MAERPILFSDAMVRAILAGTKTQTRRVVMPRKSDGAFYLLDGWPHRSRDGEGNRVPSHEEPYTCPYGQPRDRLWVRETLRNTPSGWTYAADGASVLVERDGQSYLAMVAWAHHKEGDVCVSIHMPRWASRLTLEIASVRVERVQSISEEDARAEGVSAGPSAALAETPIGVSAREAFAELWDSINGKREGCSWEANPWVWAIAFRRVSP